MANTEENEWLIIKDEITSRTIHPLVFRAFELYIVLHSSRCRNVPGAYSETYQELEIEVRNYHERKFMIMAWDQIFVTEGIIFNEKQRLSRGKNF